MWKSFTKLKDLHFGWIFCLGFMTFGDLEIVLAVAGQTAKQLVKCSPNWNSLLPLVLKLRI